MLTSRDSVDISDPSFVQLFNSAFTSEEKIPLRNLKRTFGKGGRLVFYYDSGSFIGFTYCFEYGDATFLVYFATEPEHRNKGYGASILGEIKKFYSDRKLFLVLETPDKSASDYQIRIKRHNFYLRNGWSDTGVRLLSDGFYFDSMYFGTPMDCGEMTSVVDYYEAVHNGVAE